MATRITKEWVIQVGTDGDGGAETRVIGYEVEDDFGGGNKTTRLKLCMDVLSPVLYQMAKPYAQKGSAFVYGSRKDFAKRYKDPSAPLAQAVPGPVSDPDAWIDPDNPMAGVEGVSQE